MLGHVMSHSLDQSGLVTFRPTVALERWSELVILFISAYYTKPQIVLMSIDGFYRPTTLTEFQQPSQMLKGAARVCSEVCS